jgi:nucleoside-diphosphate-sugar epimerase
MKMFPNSKPVQREDHDPAPSCTDALYLISTTHNYNIFTEPHKDIDTNLNKLISVLEACRKHNPDVVFNFVSSWFVYGMNCTMNTKETDFCDPRGFYSITKRAAEQMLVCYCQTMNMKYRILRMTNIIGETDRGVSAQKNAIQYMIGLLKRNQEVRLYDGGCNMRDFMYVDDACRAIDVCIQNSPTNEIVNISNSQPVAIGDIIRYSKEKIGSSSPIVSIDAPQFHKVVQVKDVCSINTWSAVDKLL